MRLPVQEQIRLSADPGPYDLPGTSGSVGVLLVHGFTASATETRPLADFIHARTGWRCKGILLPGHGTTVEAMDRSSAEDWLREAESGYSEMAQTCSTIFLAGVSMGAVLCCHVALHHFKESGIHGIVLMAPAFGLDPMDAMGARMLSRVKRYKGKGAETGEYFLKNKLFSYTKVPLRKIQEMCDLGKQAFEGLSPLERIPILMLAGALEQTVSLARIRSAAKRYPWIRYKELPNSEHILTVEPDQQIVLESSLSFMREFES